MHFITNVGIKFLLKTIIYGKQIFCNILKRVKKELFFFILLYIYKMFKEYFMSRMKYDIIDIYICIYIYCVYITAFMGNSGQFYI